MPSTTLIADAPLAVAQPDISLVLDLKGVIEKVTVSSAIADEQTQSWVGRLWTDVVGEFGSEKVRRIVDDARTTGVSAFRQVTQRFPSGLELPIEYTAVRLGEKGGLLAIGKSLNAVAELQTRLIAAQQVMERDYWKLREVETRYRLLFDASNEAVVLLKASTLRIVEANPAALSALDLAALNPERVAGRDFMAQIAPDERTGFEAMLERVRAKSRSPGLLIHLGEDRKPWIVRASLIGAEGGPIFVLQLMSMSATRDLAPQHEPVAVEDLMERVPDGFVVVDDDGIVRNVNRAFLDLIEAGSKASVIGERLSRWFWQPGADVKSLMTNVQKHRSVRLFETTVHGELGAETQVEISATGDSDSDPRHIVLMMRDVARRLPFTEETLNLGSLLNTIAEQIGKVPLRKIVTDTVDVVEQHHIKAVLEVAGGNRTAAAELLGLSRQALYGKLKRHSLEDE